MLLSELKRININIGGERSLGYEGGTEEFDQIASVIGYPIPDAYVKLVRYADGGHPEVCCFNVPNGDPGNSFDVDSFYSLSNPSAQRVRDVIARWGETLGEGALPIGRDGGDNQFYLNLRDGGSTVWIYLHDEDGKRIKLADDLESFIAGFYLDPDFI